MFGGMPRIMSYLVDARGFHQISGLENLPYLGAHFPLPPVAFRAWERSEAAAFFSPFVAFGSRITLLAAEAAFLPVAIAAFSKWPR